VPVKRKCQAHNLLIRKYMNRWLILLLPALLTLPLLFTGYSHTGKRLPDRRDKDMNYCLQAEQNLECMQCKG